MLIKVTLFFNEKERYFKLLEVIRWVFSNNMSPSLCNSRQKHRKLQWKDQKLDIYCLRSKVEIDPIGRFW